MENQRKISKSRVLNVTNMLKRHKKNEFCLSIPFQREEDQWDKERKSLLIQEGTYWLDHGLIKGFTSDGETHNLYKMRVYDDLNIEIREHKDFVKSANLQFETWKDTYTRLSKHLDDLSVKSIDRIKTFAKYNPNREIVLTNSTGKDSMVMQHLAELSGVDFKNYFNVTTMDVKESILMAKKNNFVFTYPKLDKYGGFYQWVKREQLIPTRLNRACCQYFKERAMMNAFHADSKLLLLFGMRNEESSARSGYTDVWVNDKWGKRDWIGLLPIREWTELDVWLYTLREGIEVNPKYRMGYSRAGCGIVCPNYGKSTWVLDKYWYNGLYNRWRKILRNDFIENNKWLIMNCTIDEYVNICWNGGVYQEEPTDEVIEEYAEYSGLDIDVARKYFNKYCANDCLNKRKQPMKLKDKTVLAMNMKMFGRQTNRFLCKKCLMKEFEWSKEDWDNMVDDFKRSGCKLF